MTAAHSPTRTDPARDDGERPARTVTVTASGYGPMPHEIGLSHEKFTQVALVTTDECRQLHRILDDMVGATSLHHQALNLEPSAVIAAVIDTVAGHLGVAADVDRAESTFAAVVSAIVKATLIAQLELGASATTSPAGRTSGVLPAPWSEASGRLKADLALAQAQPPINWSATIPPERRDDITTILSALDQVSMSTAGASSPARDQVIATLAGVSAPVWDDDLTGLGTTRQSLRALLGQTADRVLALFVRPSAEGGPDDRP